MKISLFRAHLRKVLGKYVNNFWTLGGVMHTQAQREEESPMRSHRGTFLSGKFSKTLWKGVDN